MKSKCVYVCGRCSRVRYVFVHVHAHTYCMSLFEYMSIVCMACMAAPLCGVELRTCEFMQKCVLCTYVVHVCLSLPHPSCRLQLALIKLRPVDIHSQSFVQLLLQTAAQQALQWNAVHSSNNAVTALLIFCSKINFTQV